MKYAHLHLISDSTGDTVSAISRAALSQFEFLDLIEHHWTLIRRDDQLEEVLLKIKQEPGLVLFTLVQPGFQKIVMDFCEANEIPCQPVLKPIVDKIKDVWDLKALRTPGQQHLLDDKYFFRIEAVEFALDHDDGKNIQDYHLADIILLGVSRASKTPTSMYLANKGLKVANYPIVQGAQIPEVLFCLKTPFIVGLMQDADRLIEVRKHRETGISSLQAQDYLNYSAVLSELENAQRLFRANSWPIIHVEKRSIEESAAEIIKLYEFHHNADL